MFADYPFDIFIGIHVYFIELIVNYNIPKKLCIA